MDTQVSNCEDQMIPIAPTVTARWVTETGNHLIQFVMTFGERDDLLCVGTSETVIGALERLVEDLRYKSNLQFDQHLRHTLVVQAICDAVKEAK